MSWVFDGDALKVALVLGCRPGCGVIGGRVAGQGFGALTRGFGVGVRPTAEILSFASPKESIQRKGDPKVAPLRVTLRFSSETAAAELASALRSAAQTVLADYPVSACDARRDLREPVRGGARGLGLGKEWFSVGCNQRLGLKSGLQSQSWRRVGNSLPTQSGGQQAAHPTQASQAKIIAFPRISPVGHAEHRRSARGSRRGLFERPQDVSSAAAARFEKRRATRSAAQGVTSGSPSLGYLSWRDKKGTVPAGHPRHPITRVSAQRRATHQQSFCTFPQPALLLPCKQARKPIPMRPAGQPLNGGRHA